MPEQLPYKIYKQSANYPADDKRQFDFHIGPDFNIPSGFQESSLDEFNQFATPGQKTQFGATEEFKKLSAGLPSDYTNVGGVLKSPGYEQRVAAEQAALGSGQLAQISGAQPGLYAPPGSAAQLQAQGKTFEQQIATPTVQAQIQQQGLQPVTPTQGSQGFAESLIQVYLKRPDLQELYNADGSAKNPNDPRIAGIPTLMDWVKRFGVKEEQMLGASFDEFQRQQEVQRLRVGYGSLQNENGTIVNTTTGKRYATPEELAKDLGVPVGGIEWNKIVNAPAPEGQAQNIPSTQELKKAFEEKKRSGEEAPQTPGEAASAVQTAIAGATIPKGPDFTGIEQQLAQDKGYQQLLETKAEYNNVANQSKSLLDTYNQMVKDAGIPGINAELLNAQKIIDGTEEDIRREVQAVGGFATESQVMALASARNKQLIKNYNNLLATKQMAMETINNSINLASQDRNFALQAISQKMQFDQQINEYRDKFVNNAKEGYDRIVKAVGYGGLYASLQNNPTELALVEKTLGLPSGGLAGLAAYKRPLTEEEQLDLELKQSQIKENQAQAIKAEAEAYKTLHPDAKTQVIELSNGKKALINSDTGEIIREIESDIKQITTPQQLAQNESNINSINNIIQNVTSSASVGTTGIWRWAGNPFASLSGEKQAFIGSVEQIIDQLNLDKLIQAKAQGATFGALSDNELKVLASAATRLGTWRVKNKDGEVTGYNINEKEFKKELDKINNFAKLDYILKGGDAASVGITQEDNGALTTRNSDGTITELRAGSFIGPPSPFSSAGKPQASTGMRTDRHNNPTAFTTDIAKLAGLKEDVDYTKGDPFSGGKYHTAKLLGDPIATTIKVIDRIGFKTSSGGNRWTYTDQIPGTKNWKNLSYEQKKNVVAQMYKHEGGTALKQYFA